MKNLSFCHVTLPLCSNYAVLMFDDIGPLTPNQLGPVRHEKKVRVKVKMLIKSGDNVYDLVRASFSSLHAITGLLSIIHKS